MLNLVHLRSFSGLNAWRGNCRPRMLWCGCRPGGWCARGSTRHGQTSASASTRPSPRRMCSWPRPTTLRSSRGVCATACWWGALADECPACHKLCRVADERFPCRLCHAWACPMPLVGHVAPNCMHDGSAGPLGRILHRHALALIRPLRPPLYRHLRIANARCVQPLEASDDARPLPARGRATLRHGGRTARALLEVPHAATRDACAAELPAVLWLTLGLLAADGMALQARRPPCAPDAGDPSGAVGSGRRRKLAHVSAFGAVPICRPGRCSQRRSWSSGVTQRG